MGADTLTNIEGFPNLSAVLDQYAAEVLNAYQDELIRHNKIATGELLNSATYRIQWGEEAIEVQLLLAPWWKWVEHGRKPGGKFPPRSAILKWIKDKPVLPKPDDRGKLPTPQSLAFLIGRKIAREGIPAGRYLTAAVRGQTDKWRTRIGEAIAADITRDMVILETL